MEKATPRQMFKQIGPVAFTGGEPFSPGEPATDTLAGNISGWEILTDPTAITRIMANRSYIDLSGYTQQDLTVFTQGIDIQKQQTPVPLPSGAIGIVWEFDIISTRRLTTTELTQWGTNTAIPGFFPSTVDLMEVIYGERMIYGENQTIPLAYIQLGGDTFGSGNPTTSDKLHWTRLIIMPSVTPTAVLTVYSTNLVVQAITAEEKDLVYIERLRRSYTQQRQDP